MTEKSTSDKPSSSWFICDQWKVIPAALTMIGLEWLLVGINLAMCSEPLVGTALGVIGCLVTAVGILLLSSSSHTN